MSSIRKILLFALILLITLYPWAADLAPYPEDPMIGARLFQQKGCITCHSINDIGGKIGPNLARIHLKGSLLDVAGALWNHAPVMREKMEELHIQRPQLTGQEMGNLIAFLSAYQYYLKQIGKPGNPQKGKQIFDSKNCSKCHSLQKEADFGKVGPSLRSYAKLSPIQIAQSMWNHGPAMTVEFRKLKLSQPNFQSSEMSDLLAYLQQATTPGNYEPAYVEPGNPSMGRGLFEKKGCIQCHPVRGVGGSPDVPDLGKRKEEFVRSVTDVAGIMWNHGSGMWDKMKKHKVPMVKFQDNEMADIIAYLYFINYFDKPGDANRGKELFSKKGCINCHMISKEGKSIGPDLSTSSAVGSPIETVTAMWNHANMMEPVMRAKMMAWPKFEPGEMADLMEYLYINKKK